MKSLGERMMCPILEKLSIIEKQGCVLRGRLAKSLTNCDVLVLGTWWR